jgi:hypothetical protein
MTSSIQPSGHTFVVNHYLSGGQRHEAKLILLGGYAYDRTTIVIYREPGQKEGEWRDGLMELRRNGLVRPAKCKRLAIDLASGDFARFDQLPDHYQFLLGNRWWRKLPIAQLAKRLQRGHWRTPLNGQ